MLQVLDVSLPIQLPGNGFSKAAEDGLSAWALATHVGNVDEVPHVR